MSKSKKLDNKRRKNSQNKYIEVIMTITEIKKIRALVEEGITKCRSHKMISTREKRVGFSYQR